MILLNTPLKYFYVTNTIIKKEINDNDLPRVCLAHGVTIKSEDGFVVDRSSISEQTPAGSFSSDLVEIEGGSENNVIFVLYS